MSIAEIIALVAACGGVGAAMSGVMVKFLSREGDRAAAEKVRSESREAEQRTTSGEVQTLLNIISEVRSSEAAKAQRIDGLERRLDLLEERERHMLTRAAVHEAWDQMALAHIIATGETAFPPPPPLTLVGHIIEDAAPHKH